MSFDEIIDRRGAHTVKWDGMEGFCGVSPQEGLPMWVADMEFRPPQVALDAVQRMIELGSFGYFGDDRAYREAVRWWAEARHGVSIDPAHIFTTNGLVNAIAVILEAFTAPGDGVVVFSPVYHAFGRVVRTAGRELIECEMAVDEAGLYRMDLESYDIPDHAKVLILCTPHNPAGRVWSRAELEEVAAFAKRHDLLLVSDEIHQDIVLPGHRHIPTALIEGVEDRLITLSAASKTFNIAGAHTGQVIIADAGLRERFAARMAGLGVSPNAIGMHMTTAAYSPAGAEWVDEMCEYLAGNLEVFADGIAAIPGLTLMPQEGTYLSWVSFEGTGMSLDEVLERIQGKARIAPSPGPSFGTGGDHWLRFNIAMPRPQIEEAVRRLQEAFADLQ
ncbi:MalY/PatB family protein [Pseudoroseicyclus tamaricis]|uniref:cysteine-S-conjugate beta-lyase n=1 Tax=Pseudoroseicyclus tamaricis TaxID=2705421 RepID=A0A6B2JNE2_9RHOB|nr:PatB family C-S lyase [Pseudoroseicyclus tamaricis]NDU99434.1 putative C-S lyase [Pseudoroseicyclus tamaricis]